MQIPIYLFTGFLESGKTTFIKDTIADPEFTRGLKTLLIVAEEGEEEYEEAVLKKSKTTLVTIEDEDELSYENMLEWNKKYAPDQIVVEYNGMWKVQEFIEGAMPKGWFIAEILAVVNADTFDAYLSNMRGVVFDPLNYAEVIVFNRCDDDTDKAGYRRMVKAVNRQAQIIYERKDGTIDNNVDEVLPFDITADQLDIGDEDFGIWYMDAMDHPDKYAGKIVRFKAIVYKPKGLLNRMPKGTFIPGRHAMTCCADDVAFIGFKCISEEADKVNHRDWIRISAKVKKEYAKEYEGEGPVLYSLQIEPAEKPKEELVYFN